MAMDLKVLTPVLEALRPQLLAVTGGAEAHWSGLGRSFPYELERAVAQWLETDPPLPTTRPFGGIHLSLTGAQLARAVLGKTVDESAEGAVAWLEKVIATEAADVRVVAEVRGLTVSGVVELPGGVRCSAIDLSPRSPRILDLEPTRTPADFLRRSLEPTTSVLWIGLPGLRYADAKAGDTAQRQAMGLLWRAVLGLTLLPDQAPLITRMWTEFDDGDLALAVAGIGWTPQIDDGAALPNPLPPITQADVEPAAAYLHLPTEMADQLALAISRVSLARRRRQSDNQAIEVCTAIESLFGDKNNEQELIYRLRLRAALYLGETLEARRAIREKLGKLYKIRSRAVHGGSGGAPPGSGPLIAFGIDLAIKATRKIIAAGIWPDWPDLELAPPPLRAAALDPPEPAA
jgi:hypothetical protein